eukprot:31131-Pelagococcus_subviridis.AAC.3
MEPRARDARAALSLVRPDRSHVHVEGPQLLRVSLQHHQANLAHRLRAQRAAHHRSTHPLRSIERGERHLHPAELVRLDRERALKVHLRRHRLVVLHDEQVPLPRALRVAGSRVDVEPAERAHVDAATHGRSNGREPAVILRPHAPVRPREHHPVADAAHDAVVHGPPPRRRVRVGGEIKDRGARVVRLGRRARGAALDAPRAFERVLLVSRVSRRRSRGAVHDRLVRGRVQEDVHDRVEAATQRPRRGAHRRVRLATLRRDPVRARDRVSQRRLDRVAVDVDVADDPHRGLAVEFHAPRGVAGVEHRRAELDAAGDGRHHARSHLGGERRGRASRGEGSRASGGGGGGHRARAGLGGGGGGGGDDASEERRAEHRVTRGVHRSGRGARVVIDRRDARGDRCRGRERTGRLAG